MFSCNFKRFTHLGRHDVAEETPSTAMLISREGWLIIKTLLYVHGVQLVLVFKAGG